jgi:diaminopropionate ammonia-lyase
VSIRTLVNPDAREVLGGPAPDRAPLAFHRRLPGYEETPLVDAPRIAEPLGVGKVWVKDESDRLGLPAFKVLGASWAACSNSCGAAGRAPNRRIRRAGL